MEIQTRSNNSKQLLHIKRPVNKKTFYSVRLIDNSNKSSRERVAVNVKKISDSNLFALTLINISGWSLTLKSLSSFLGGEKKNNLKIISIYIFTLRVYTIHIVQRVYYIYTHAILWSLG